MPSKKIKGEVPLPSQEGKKGAIQFALYVYVLFHPFDVLTLTT